MNYTLHQLQVFLKVTQTGSITKAAEDLHLTQPAVSIQLKNLQDQFDIPLTEVVGRKLFITDFGREIALAAENILNEVYAINYKTLAYKGQLSGRLKLSVVSTGKYVIPYFLSNFLKMHEGIELILDVTNKARVLENLEKNEVDFSLVSAAHENPSMETIPLMKNKLFLVANANFPLTQDVYKADVLTSMPLIYREKGSATRVSMENFISRNELEINSKIELTSNEAVKQAVIAGLGCSIMPLIGIKNELANGSLKIIPVEGLPIVSTWHLIWLKNKRFSPAAKAYLNFLKIQKEQLIKEHFSWFEEY